MAHRTMGDAKGVTGSCCAPPEGEGGTVRLSGPGTLFLMDRALCNFSDLTVYCFALAGLASPSTAANYMKTTQRGTRGAVCALFAQPWSGPKWQLEAPRGGCE